MPAKPIIQIGNPNQRIFDFNTPHQNSPVTAKANAQLGIAGNIATAPGNALT